MDYINFRNFPIHCKKEMRYLLEIVRFLNDKYNVNKWYDKRQKISPFTLQWMKKGEWKIVCDSHPVWEDSEFKKMKVQIITEFKEVKFSWGFQYNVKVFVGRVFKVK